MDDYSDSLKLPFYSEDTALGLAEQVDKKKNWLKDVRGDITNTMENLKLQAKTIQEKQNLARSQGDRRTVNLLDIELNKLRATYQKQQRRIAGSEKSIKESIEDLSVPLTVGEQPENAGRRVYTQRETGVRGQKIGKQLLDMDLADEVVDEIDTISSANIDPETVGLRSERRIIDTELKGGQGRKQAEALSPRPDNPLDTLVPLQPRGTGEGLLDSRRLNRQTTRPIIDAIQQDTGVTDTKGLELSPKIFPKEEGGVTDIYGRRLASNLKDDDRVRPTQLVGKVQGSQTQKPTRAGRESIQLSEQLRRIYNDQSIPPEVRSLKAQNLLKSLGVERTPTPQIKVDQGPVVTGSDGITRGEGLRMTPLQVLKLKRQIN